MLDEIEDEEQRFKADVASRPDEASLEDYEKIPVEAFGKALLRGMGWSEGTPIGKTNAK
jgi:G patch domain/KOW motif-containing protein